MPSFESFAAETAGDSADDVVGRSTKHWAAPLAVVNQNLGASRVLPPNLPPEEELCIYSYGGITRGALDSIIAHSSGRSRGSINEAGPSGSHLSSLMPVLPPVVRAEINSSQRRQRALTQKRGIRGNFTGPGEHPPHYL